jgi:hypothetical protein
MTFEKILTTVNSITGVTTGIPDKIREWIGQVTHD